jgi:glycosyltransferase involved in cell wall biosynthesis
MDAKPELIIFSNYVIGGVASFWENLVKQDPVKQFHKKVIYLNYQPTAETILKQPFGFCDDLVFTINESDSETVYETAKRLGREISNREGAVLANFSTELASLHLYRKNNKTIFFVCHDMAYVSDAVKYAFLIDAYIVHNPGFVEILQSKIPGRQKDIHYIPYGITPNKEFIKTIDTNEPLRLVWLARLKAHKGIFEIPVINGLLKELGVPVHWTIIGDGPEKIRFKELVQQEENFDFFQGVEDSAVTEILKKQDVFVLPSFLDGLPVAMLESMAVGCVPVISEFNSGISKIITEETGFVLPQKDNAGFAASIQFLHQNRNLLARLSKNAKQLVEQNYDIAIQSDKYYALFLQYQSLKKRHRKKFINYGFSTHPWIPVVCRKYLLRLSRFLQKIRQ